MLILTSLGIYWSYLFEIWPLNFQINGFTGNGCTFEYAFRNKIKYDGCLSWSTKQEKKDDMSTFKHPMRSQTIKKWKNIVNNSNSISIDVSNKNHDCFKNNVLVCCDTDETLSAQNITSKPTESEAQCSEQGQPFPGIPIALCYKLKIDRENGQMYCHVNSLLNWGNNCEHACSSNTFIIMDWIGFV